MTDFYHRASSREPRGSVPPGSRAEKVNKWIHIRSRGVDGDFIDTGLAEQRTAATSRGPLFDCKKFAHPPGAAVDEDLFAGLGVLKVDETDIGQQPFTRVAQTDRDQVVAPAQMLQR